MNKKVLINSTTLRNNGNFAILAKEFEKGATDCGDIEENSLTMKEAYEMGKNV